MLRHGIVQRWMQRRNEWRIKVIRSSSILSHISIEFIRRVAKKTVSLNLLSLFYRVSISKRRRNSGHSSQIAASTSTKSRIQFRFTFLLSNFHSRIYSQLMQITSLDKCVYKWLHCLLFSGLCLQFDVVWAFIHAHQPQSIVENNLSPTHLKCDYSKEWRGKSMSSNLSKLSSSWNMFSLT